MHVQVRRVDHSEDISSPATSCARIRCSSMDESIADLRLKIADHFAIPDPRQVRMFFAGKELQSRYTIFHYGIKLDHVIQVLTRDSQSSQSSSWSREESGAIKNDRIARNGKEQGERKPQSTAADQSNPGETIARNSYQAMDYASSARESSVSINSSVEPAADDAADNENEESDGATEERDSDDFFSVGDFVDALHPDLGSWFEARVQRITCYYSRPASSSSGSEMGSPLRPSPGMARMAVGQRTVSDPQGSEALAARTRYYVKFLRSSLASVIPLERKQIRLQSWVRIGFQQVHEGARVLANFNLNSECSGERGYWYDCLITNKDRRGRKLRATVFIGGSSPSTTSIRVAATSVHEVQTIRTAEALNAAACAVCVQDQRIRSPDELYLIEESVKRRDRSPRSLRVLAEGAPALRKIGFECHACKDDPERSCKVCSCKECGGKEEPDKQIVCDECSLLYHFWCLPQPLDHLPPEHEEWFCPSCKNNDLELIKRKEAEHLARKEKHRSRLLSSRTDKEHDHNSPLVSDASPEIRKKSWGHGMACVGRRTDRVTNCFSSEHFGPIPGVEVGTWYRYRFQVSEAGLHGPLVAGICGKADIGASSIVFSCSYPEDIDLGEEIFFTGSGGRNLTESGSRTGGPQIKDQQLTRSNKALAIACYANFNTSTGASAGINWKNGKAIRVLRSGNARGSSKKSPYLPKIGIRYDGIYKVVKYWPERNDTGLIVWRFLLRRDDPCPAAWTRAGKNRNRRLRLDRIIEPTAESCPNPDASPGMPLRSSSSSIASHASFESEASGDREATLSPQCLSGAGVYSEKRKRNPGTESRKWKEKRIGSDGCFSSTSYELPADIDQLIDADSCNSRLWEQIRNTRLAGKREFLMNVRQTFQCVVCVETQFRQPVSTKCGHFFCRDCLIRSIDSIGRMCPACRTDLPAKLPAVNWRLKRVLNRLFAL